MFGKFINAMKSVLGMDPGTTRNTTGTNTSAFDKLPPELKEQVAAFLPTRDLLKLAETFESLFIATSALTDRASRNYIYRTVILGPKVFAVVIPKEAGCAHSFTFTCNAHNERMANANFSIVEQDIPPNLQEPSPVDYYRRPEVLKHMYHGCGSIVADGFTRGRCKISLSFSVKPNKFYQFYVFTNGHETPNAVHVFNMKLQRVGFSVRSTEYTAYQFDAYVRPASHAQAALY